MVILELIHAKSPDVRRDVFIRSKTNRGQTRLLVIHSNLANRMLLQRRCIIRISALSTFDGKVVAYHGDHG